MATFTIYRDFGAQESKVCHYSPSICHEVMGLNGNIKGIPLTILKINLKSIYKKKSLVNLISKVPKLTFQRKKSLSDTGFIGTILLIIRREI